MSDSIRITKAANGYMIEARDPEIDEANRSTDAKWRDPYVTIVCKTPQELAAAVDKLLPALCDDDDEDEENEVDSAFKQAVKEIMQ